MRLAGIKTGDLVRLKGDAAYWLVLMAGNGEARIVLPGRPLTERSVKATEIGGWWRKMPRT